MPAGNPHFSFNWFVPSLSYISSQELFQAIPQHRIRGLYCRCSRERWWGLRRGTSAFPDRGDCWKLLSLTTQPSLFSYALSEIGMQGKKMTTVQFLQGNVNKTPGSLKHALPHSTSCAGLSPGLHGVYCSHQGQEEWGEGPFLANHTMDLKQLTHAQFFSNHSVNEQGFGRGEIVTKIFSQLAMCLYTNNSQILRK